MPTRILNIQKDKLSPIQKVVFNFIKKYFLKHEYGPTEQEIATQFKFSRTNAQFLVRILVDKGFLVKKRKRQVRGITIAKGK